MMKNNTKQTFKPLSILCSLVICSANANAKDFASACDIDKQSMCATVTDYLSQPFIAEPGFAARKTCKQITQKVYGLQKHCEFDQYLAKANQAMSDYKTKALTVWGEAKVTGQHNWVQYSEDFSLRSEVDYQNGTIDISIAGDYSDDTFIRIAEQEMEKVLAITQSEAVKADPFLKVLQESDAENVKTKVKTKPEKAADSAENDKPTSASEKMLAMVEQPSEILAQVKAAPIKKIDATSAPVKSENRRQKASQSPITKRMITVKFPNNWMLKRARQLKPLFETQTSQWQLESALGLAMMYTESSFNPMAKSPIPAYGLMQVVPNSAGVDVNDFLFSKRRAPTPTQLFVEQVNIKFGGGYLKLLRDRYFKKIKDPLAKKYCMIAAYNTGPGNVAKAFTGEMKLKAAVKEINRLTPEQVHQTLLNKLPYEETRQYLKKVLKEEQRFAQI